VAQQRSDITPPNDSVDTQLLASEDPVSLIDNGTPEITVAETQALSDQEQEQDELPTLLLQQAQEIGEEESDTNLPASADNLNDLALYYFDHGKYEQAAALFQKTLALCVREKGPAHIDTATCLNNLAGTYYVQGKYEQAEPLLHRALTICERVLSTTDPDLVDSLNNLGMLYEAEGRYGQAEALFQRSLEICRQTFGSTHSQTVACFNHLARLYRRQGQY